MTTTLPHVLTVTGLVDDEGCDSREYTLTCPGVTDACRAYWDCARRDCGKDALDRAADNGEEPMRHGQIHKRIDLGWCVRSDDCLYVGNDRFPDAAADLDLPSGTYEVDVEYVGDMEIALVLLSPRPEAATR